MEKQSKQKIKKHFIFTFSKFAKSLVFFGYDCNKPFIDISKYWDDFMIYINPKKKKRLALKIRNYAILAIKGNIIKVTNTAKTYHEVITFTENGAKYLLNRSDNILLYLLSGFIGSAVTAIITIISKSL